MPRFADILGQNAVHDRLRNSVGADRLPHALLFHGAPGTGKTSTAFALAQYLNCDERTDVDACGVCNACRKIAKLQHPDVRWIFPMPGSLKGDKRAAHVRDTMDERVEQPIHVLTFPEAAGIAIGRDEDTRLGSVGELRKQASMSPVEGRVKVFVVSEAERMRFEAANSLLKVLEEPPEHNLIVLTTSRPRELLDTIVSRCQSVRFRDLTEPELAGILMERAQIAEPVEGRKRKKSYRAPTGNEAALASALARGSLSRAAAFLDEDVIELRDKAVALLRLTPGDPRLQELLAELHGARDRNLLERVLDFALLWQGDLLRALTQADVPLANRDREDQVRAEAQSTTVDAIRRRVESLEQARIAIRGNVYVPLLLLNLSQALAGRTAAVIEAV